MSARRCSICAIDYPGSHDPECDACGGKTSWMGTDNPHEDWEERVEQVREKLNQEKDPVVAWRFSELVKAGYELNQAVELSHRRDIDLHRAVELAGKTELAYEIVS